MASHDSSSAGTPRRPNFVLILTDDQGPWAVPWLMPELRMPNLEELADDSVVLDNYYCASPVCSPARASLLTGRMPSAHGVHDWLVGTRSPQAHPDLYLDELTTLPALLAGSGHLCGLSGKWHVGESREPAPGFSYWYAHRYGGGPYFDAPVWKDGEEAAEGHYFTRAVAEHAVEFLRLYAEDRIDSPETTAPGDEPGQRRPFYLQICPTAPHDPWDSGNHPDDLLDLYQDCEFPSVPREPRHPWTQPRRADFEHAFADPATSLRGYCASLSGVDRLLGQVLAELERTGLADDTIIFYMADNGFSCGHHGVWGKGNGTFPLNMWENSVRVPFLMHVPPAMRHSANLSQELRRVCELSGSHVDDHGSALSFFPTVCGLAGVPMPADPLRGGKSMLPVLGGGEGTGEPVVIHDEYGGSRMIRRGPWKYVTRYDGPTELYNLDEDPGEVDNLADDPGLADVRDSLLDELEDWFARHETAQHRAFDQPVTGFGQIHPTWRRDEPTRYMPMGGTTDGVRR